jgi:hypothetical protein
LGGASSIITDSSCPEPPQCASRITVVAIDDMIDPGRPLAIIQLDIEGYENEALLGARRTIERNLPVIILETQPHTLIRCWMDNLGYRHSLSLHDNTVWVAKG